MPFGSEDAITALIAGIVLQAVEDYRMDYRHAHYPDAATFLRSAGLLTEQGLDVRFTRTVTRTGRTSHKGSRVAA